MLDECSKESQILALLPAPARGLGGRREGSGRAGEGLPGPLTPLSFGSPAPAPIRPKTPPGGVREVGRKTFPDRLHSRGCCSSPPRAGIVSAGGGGVRLLWRVSLRTPMPAPRPFRHETAPGAAVGAPNRAENTGFRQEKTGPKNGRSSETRAG